MMFLAVVISGSQAVVATAAALGAAGFSFLLLLPLLGLVLFIKRRMYI